MNTVPDSPIHVLIADGSYMMRKLIRQLLEDEQQIKVIGDVDNLEDALSIAVDATPDVFLMDSLLQRINESPAVFIRLAFLSYARHILAMSTQTDQQETDRAASYGAVRLLDKFGLSEELVATILRYGRRPRRHFRVSATAGATQPQL